MSEQQRAPRRRDRRRKRESPVELRRIVPQHQEDARWQGQTLRDYDLQAPPRRQLPPLRRRSRSPSPVRREPQKRKRDSPSRSSSSSSSSSSDDSNASDDDDEEGEVAFARLDKGAKRRRLREREQQIALLQYRLQKQRIKLLRLETHHIRVQQSGYKPACGTPVLFPPSQKPLLHERARSPSPPREMLHIVLGNKKGHRSVQTGKLDVNATTSNNNNNNNNKIIPVTETTVEPVENNNTATANEDNVTVSFRCSNTNDDEMEPVYESDTDV